METQPYQRNINANGNEARNSLLVRGNFCKRTLFSDTTVSRVQGRRKEAALRHNNHPRNARAFHRAEKRENARPAKHVIQMRTGALKAVVPYQDQQDFDTTPRIPEASETVVREKRVEFVSEALFPGSILFSCLRSSSPGTSVTSWWKDVTSIGIGFTSISPFFPEIHAAGGAQLWDVGSEKETGEKMGNFTGD